MKDDEILSVELLREAFKKQVFVRKEENEQESE